MATLYSWCTILLGLVYHRAQSNQTGASASTARYLSACDPPSFGTGGDCLYRGACAGDCKHLNDRQVNSLSALNAAFQRWSCAGRSNTHDHSCRNLTFRNPRGRTRCAQVKEVKIIRCE
ncbi:hypothetical protein BGX38DRAFT_435725 [Terfezia claveryi]|nr:hypothetical protein BGX38DRAFT_435725 [Terfezia claveryi]